MLKVVGCSVATGEGPEGGFDALRAIGLSRARLMMRGRGADPRPPAMSTVRRWMMLGCPVGGGMLRLQGRRINGEYLTMPHWVLEFEAERARHSHLGGGAVQG